MAAEGLVVFGWLCLGRARAGGVIARRACYLECWVKQRRSCRDGSGDRGRAVRGCKAGFYTCVFHSKSKCQRAVNDVCTVRNPVSAQ